ncbi:MAG: protease, partial [Bacteroidota bacterium]
MQRILIVCALAFTVFSCTEEALPTTVTPETDLQQTPLTKGEINKIVEAHLFATNDVYDWNDASDHVVWSALELSKYEAALGYQPAGYRNINETIHEIDVTAGAWKTTRDELVADLLSATERFTGEPITEEELFVAPEDEVLPILEVKVLHPGVLAEFRERPEVRYLEPSNYSATDVDFRSGSGCSEASSSNFSSGDRLSYQG